MHVNGLSALLLPYFGEEEKDYLWALERLRSLYETCNVRLPSVILTDRCLACMNAVATCFPTATSLLCLWHANKAVLQHCQPAFKTAEASSWDTFYQAWHSIMSSPDEETFKERVQELERNFLPEYLQEVGYIKTTWLDPYKEKLVKVLQAAAFLRHRLSSLPMPWTCCWIERPSLPEKHLAARYLLLPKGACA